MVNALKDGLLAGGAMDIFHLARGASALLHVDGAVANEVVVIHVGEVVGTDREQAFLLCGIGIEVVANCCRHDNSRFCHGKCHFAAFAVSIVFFGEFEGTVSAYARYLDVARLTLVHFEAHIVSTCGAVGREFGGFFLRAVEINEHVGIGGGDFQEARLRGGIGIIARVEAGVHLVAAERRGDGVGDEVALLDGFKGYGEGNVVHAFAASPFQDKLLAGSGLRGHERGGGTEDCACGVVGKLHLRTAGECLRASHFHETALRGGGSKEVVVRAVEGGRGVGAGRDFEGKVAGVAGLQFSIHEVEGLIGCGSVFLRNLDQIRFVGLNAEANAEAVVGLGVGSRCGAVLQHAHGVACHGFGFGNAHEARLQGRVAVPINAGGGRQHVACFLTHEGGFAAHAFFFLLEGAIGHSVGVGRTMQDIGFTRRNGEVDLSVIPIVLSDGEFCFRTLAAFFYGEVGDRLCRNEGERAAFHCGVFHVEVAVGRQPCGCAFRKGNGRGATIAGGVVGSIGGEGEFELAHLIGVELNDDRLSLVHSNAVGASALAAH